MNISLSGLEQDTLTGKFIVNQDSVLSVPDSIPVLKNITVKVSPIQNPSAALIINGNSLADTSSSCRRNSITDITFYDSTNFILKRESEYINRFPFLFTEKNRHSEAEKKATIVKQLKPGLEIPVRPLNENWIIGIILLSAFLYSIIRNTSKSMLPGVTRFFLFRGINDPASRDIGGLFHWQSTILNLISFFVIALFTFFAAFIFGIIPSDVKGFYFWLISLGVIISAVTLRHIVCFITGNISGEREVFREYILGIYQSYRFSALFLFVIVILIAYTTLLPAKAFSISGFIIIGVMYLIRIIRLSIIFINRNISIFYLILYLCALEILPVLVSVKYFTGLV